MRRKKRKQSQKPETVFSFAKLCAYVDISMGRSGVWTQMISNEMANKSLANKTTKTTPTQTRMNKNFDIKKTEAKKRMKTNETKEKRFKGKTWSSNIFEKNFQFIQEKRSTTFHEIAILVVVGVGDGVVVDLCIENKIHIQHFTTHK